MLIASGANVNADRDLIRRVVFVVSDKIFDALTAAGADVNAKGDWKQTALHLAASRGCVETVARLVAAGADVNIKDVYGMTARDVAVRNNDTGVVDALDAAERWASRRTFVAIAVGFDGAS